MRIVVDTYDPYDGMRFLGTEEFDTEDVTPEQFLEDLREFFLEAGMDRVYILVSDDSEVS